MMVGIVLYVVFMQVILKLSEAYEEVDEYVGRKAEAVDAVAEPMNVKSKAAKLKDKALTTLTILITNFQLLNVLTNIKFIRVKLPKFILELKLSLDFFFDLDMFKLMTAPDCFAPNIEWGAAWILNMVSGGWRAGWVEGDASGQENPQLKGWVSCADQFEVKTSHLT